MHFEGCAEKISPGSCNHDRAPQYYAESISSKVGFWGFRCAHWYLYAASICSEFFCLFLNNNLIS